MVIPLLTLAQKNQKLDSYTASNGVTYTKGDIISIGKGSGDNGIFTYITISGIMQTAGAQSQNSLQPSSAMTEVEIKRIKKYNYKSIKGVFMYVGIGGVSNYMVNIERAIEECEVLPCNSNSDIVVVDKYEQLSKLKELLDSGVLTKEEFESEKSKILRKP